MALTIEEARQILASGNAPPELMQEANATYYGQFTRVSDTPPPPQIGTSPVAPVGVDQSLFRNDLPGVNPLNFATQQTAQQIAAYLGGTVSTETAMGQSFFSPGTPLALEALQIEVGGARLNAGQVAVIYQNNPKEVADAIIRANIQGAGGTPPSSFQQTAPSFARAPQSQQTTVQPAPNTFWNGSEWVAQPKPVSSAAPPGPSAAVTNPTTADSHSGTQPPGATNVVPISSGVSMDQAVNLADQIKAAGVAGMGGNMGTCDEWNWFYTQVTNSPPFSCEQLGYTRDANQQAPRVTFEDWWPRVERLRGGSVQPGAAPGSAAATAASAFGDIQRAIREKGLLAIVYMALAGDAAAPR